MKVLVTGSRTIEDDSLILDCLRECRFDPDTVIHGGGSRVDVMGTGWATENDADIEAHPVPEWVWEQFGKSAGPQRNSYMVGQADACVAIWDGESAGTKDTFRKAESAGMPVHKFVVDDGEVESERFYENDQQRLTDFEKDG